VGSFSADWLALREPADHAARSVPLTEAVAARIAGVAAPAVLDLGAGAGSNYRYLAPRFAQARWLLVDHDPALLARVAPAPDVSTRCVDLATLDDREMFAGRSLVTASALLDLVSERWLTALAACCADVETDALFALSYDGRITCSPADPDDDMVVALVNEHQRTDKGFGPALGPDATSVAARLFEEAGYDVQRASSDWVLSPGSGELQRQLIDGWAQAATSIAPQRARAIDAWRDRRFAHVAAGWSEITVGHEDVAAWPSAGNRVRSRG
jgi:hypothetical protein